MKHWRRVIASNDLPCGSYALAKRAGSRPQHSPRIGGRRTCRSPARASNGARWPHRFTFLRSGGVAGIRLPSRCRLHPISNRRRPALPLAHSCVWCGRSESNRQNLLGLSEAPLPFDHGRELVRRARLELALPGLSCRCLLPIGLRARRCWFRAEVSNPNLSAFKAQRPHRQLARIDLAAPEGLEPSAFRVQSAAAGPAS